MTAPSRSPEPPPRSSGGKGRSSLLFFALSLGLLAILALLAYLFLDRLSGLQAEMVKLGHQLETVARKTEETAEIAQEAGKRAVAAEEVAREAAGGRLLAELDRDEAEMRALRAGEEAESARREAERARHEMERLRREREEELNRLQETLSRIVETRRTALGLVMSLGGDSLQFDFDRAELRAENRELLSRIAGVLLTSGNYGVYVYGHTDDVGTEEYNLDLSERRAFAVRDYLVEAGIDPGIVSVRGFGKSQPVAPGTSPEARAKNRRVEIGIVDTSVQYHRAFPAANP